MMITASTLPQRALNQRHLPPVDQRSPSRRTLLGLAPVVLSCPPLGGMCKCARCGVYDRYFAFNMAVGMRDYEAKIAPHKAALFAKLFDALQGTTVLEVGIGTAPNLEYYAGKVQCVGCSTGLTSHTRAQQQGVQVIGVDPDPEMQPYANETAEMEFQQPGDSLQLLTGSAEKLPLPDASVDVAVCTLVLCSVKQPTQALEEVLRVLKPGGRFAFLEHVYAPADRKLLRAAQTLLNPLQQVLADGCHLTRDALGEVERAGFARVDAERFVVEGLSYLGPHVAGVATKGD